MKMTFQPKTRQRSKVHGFRKRMSTANGRKFYQHNRTVSYGIIDVSLGRRFVAFFFLIRDDSMITMI